jgi:hypothetical protein
MEIKILLDMILIKISTGIQIYGILMEMRGNIIVILFFPFPLILGIPLYLYDLIRHHDVMPN